MKYILIMLLIPHLAFALSCDRVEKISEYVSMNGKKFMDAYKKHKLAGNADELRVAVGDVNQARKLAYNFPALKDMGFPAIGKSWEPFVVKMERSSLKGLRSGWKHINEAGDIAIVRLDYDPIKGAHYNIDITKKTMKGKEPYKLSIEFDCNGLPCTGDQVKKLAQNFN